MEAADNATKRCPNGYEEVKKKKSCQEACCMLEIPFNQNEEFKDSKPDFKNDRNCFIRKNKCSQKKMHGSKILCIRGIIIFLKGACCSDNIDIYVIVFTLVSINKYIIFRRRDR